MSNIRPELKYLHSPDVPDLERPTFGPSDPFCVLVQAMFGVVGEQGEESFDLLVCNPPWLNQRVHEGPLSGQHHLIVQQFDVREIRAFLTAYANHCSGATWKEVAEKIGRIGRWEFENFVPYKAELQSRCGD